MIKVVVVGGGFSGCAAAASAAKAGAKVVLLERTDMLSGAGLRACRLYSNGKLVVAEEAKALGGGELFEALDSIILHRRNLLDEEHTAVYDVTRIDPTMRQAVKGAGVELRLETRIVDVDSKDGLVKAVVTEKGERIPGDSFVDCSGSFGGTALCTKYGQGCVMCLHRCHVFGNPVSIAIKAGASKVSLLRPDGTPGRLSPSVCVFKESLSAELRTRLEKEGAISIPLPSHLVNYDKETNLFGGARGRSQQEHINLVDVGLVGKCVRMGYFKLEDLRSITGFERVMIEHPMGGSRFNFVVHLDMVIRDKAMKVTGLKNVFVAGERGGISSIDAVIAVGALSGHNAVCSAAGKELIILPESTTVMGDFIGFVTKLMETAEGLKKGTSMGHGGYFERIKQLGLYSANRQEIHERIKNLGLSGILGQKVAW